MHLRGVHHIAIFTRDLARLEAFYTQTLGFPVVQRWDDVGIVFVDAGGLWLELTRQDLPGGSAHPHMLDQGVGMNHLALQVASVDIMFQRLKELGVHMLVPPADYKSVRSAFFADPDGNVLELI